MSTVLALIKKELKTYFNSPIAYIFLTVFLVLTSWMHFRTFFLNNQASMRNYFVLLPWIFLFFVPAISMRLFSEEKKSGTLEVLMTLPVSDINVVLGKFFASFILLALSLLMTLPLYIITAILGDPDHGVIFTQYFSALLLGAAYLSIGLFVSSFTKNQIIAFIMATVFTFLLLIVGESLLLFTLPAFIAPLFQYIALSTHFESMARGVIDSRDLIYYFSIIFIFLALTSRNLAARKWK